MLTFEDGQICRWVPGQGFVVRDRPVYVVGVNYVARYVCTNFWEDWRPEVIAADLAQIAATGLNAVRIPVHWEYAEPEPGHFRAEMLERLDAFLEMAREQGLLVMPWFLVGVATQYYDVTWRARRSFFCEEMIVAAERHLRTLVERLRHHPNILCWDICDEPEGYSLSPDADRPPYDTEQFHAWLDRLYRAVKSTDPERAVTLGFGPIVNSDFGIDIRRAARTLDVMAVTAYPPHKGEDLIHGFRSAYFLGWSVRLNDCVGKGVFTCEAPGYTDCDASEANIGHFYRVALMSNLANGSAGVLPWVWNDFDEAIQHLPPLDLETLEKRFGISRADGSLKPAGEELRRFAEFVAAHPPAEWTQVQPEVGVVVTALPKRGWPNVDDSPLLAQVHREFSPLFHNYLLLRQAGLRVRYIWPDEISSFTGKLLWLPASVQQPLTTTHWTALARWVEQGGTLASSSPHLSAVTNDLYGLTVEGKMQRRDPMTVSACLPPFTACLGLALPPVASFVAVTPRSAEVVLTGDDDMPLALRHQHGSGMALFLPCQPENGMAALGAEELARYGVHEVARAAAELAGLQSPVACPDPCVELDLRRHADGRLLVILVNHSRFPVRTTIQQPQKGDIPVDLGGSGVHWLVIDPQGD